MNSIFDLIPSDHPIGKGNPGVETSPKIIIIIVTKARSVSMEKRDKVSIGIGMGRSPR